MNIFIKILKQIVFRFITISPNVKASIWVRGYNNITFEGPNIIPEFCNFSGQIEIGSNTTLGIHNLFHGKIQIGRYCQIGAYVAIHATNHPISYPTSYINARLLHGELSKFKSEKPVRIGNDVWIGHGVIILSGVTIGDGSIVGAGSVVTKDVEPYSIVAGNPARILRKRFSAMIIKELLEFQWWNKGPDEVISLREFFHTDLSKVESIYDIIQK